MIGNDSEMIALWAVKDSKKREETRGPGKKETADDVLAVARPKKAGKIEKRRAEKQPWQGVWWPRWGARWSGRIASAERSGAR
jgi:hypothetical protein